MNFLLQKMIITILSLNIFLNVSYINQMPDYPTGCESVSTVMVLNYEGYSITIDEFIDNYLNITYIPYDGVFYDAFLGNPRSENGMLCFPSVIKSAIDKYHNTIKEQDKTCIDATGMDFDELVKELWNDNPIIIWVTTNYEMPHEVSGKWGKYYTPNHAVVITGVNYMKNIVYINDPIKGQIEVDYDKIKEIYNAKGKMAIYIKNMENV